MPFIAAIRLFMIYLRGRSLRNEHHPRTCRISSSNYCFEHVVALVDGIDANPVPLLMCLRQLYFPDFDIFFLFRGRYMQLLYDCIEGKAVPLNETMN